MKTEQSELNDEDQIRELIEDRAAAARAGDVDRAMRCIAPDMVSFDVVNELQSNGSGPARNRAEAWFSSFAGPIGYEILDLHLHVGDGVAFSHSLNRYSGTQAGPVEINMWVRATTCYRKIGGAWMITHEHQSVPFDGESGRALLALAP